MLVDMIDRARSGETTACHPRLQLFDVDVVTPKEPPAETRAAAVTLTMGTLR